VGRKLDTWCQSDVYGNARNHRHIVTVVRLAPYGKDQQALATAIKGVNLDTVVGKLSWSGGPVPKRGQDPPDPRQGSSPAAAQPDVSST
jgi:hypothetical protein